jgi:hypothetical protein
MIAAARHGGGGCVCLAAAADAATDTAAAGSLRRGSLTLPPHAEQERLVYHDSKRNFFCEVNKRSVYYLRHSE